MQTARFACAVEKNLDAIGALRKAGYVASGAKLTPAIRAHEVAQNALGVVLRQHERARVVEDVVEEIARIVGYDKIESAIPAIAESTVSSAAYRTESRIAHAFAAGGA